MIYKCHIYYICLCSVVIMTPHENEPTNRESTEPSVIKNICCSGKKKSVQTDALNKVENAKLSEVRLENSSLTDWMACHHTYL